MSAEEHYFENLLCAYIRHSDQYINELLPDDPNIKWFSKETKRAIEICASYLIDCCNWDPNVLSNFLDGNYKTTS